MFTIVNDVEVENELINLQLFNITGSWKDNFQEIHYHLVKEEDGYGLIKEFDDGSFHMINVTYENCENYCIFSVPDSPDDEFFVLIGNQLDLRDSQGLIDTFQTI